MAKSCWFTVYWATVYIRALYTLHLHVCCQWLWRFLIFCLYTNIRHDLFVCRFWTNAGPSIIKAHQRLHADYMNDAEYTGTSKSYNNCIKRSIKKVVAVA